MSVTGVAVGAHANSSDDTSGDADQVHLEGVGQPTDGSERVGQNFVTDGVTDEASAILQQILSDGSDDPLMLPTELPPLGVPTEGNFLLTGVPITDLGEEGRVWVTEFAADALPPSRGSASGYTVYQSPITDDDASRCGGVPQVVRQVEVHRLTICLGPKPTEAATNYWSTVPFSADLDRVAWLDVKSAS